MHNNFFEKFQDLSYGNLTPTLKLITQSNFLGPKTLASP
jgi:hypothetical protein